MMKQTGGQRSWLQFGNASASAGASETQAAATIIMGSPTMAAIVLFRDDMLRSFFIKNAFDEESKNKVSQRLSIYQELYPMHHKLCTNYQHTTPTIRAQESTQRVQNPLACPHTRSSETEWGHGRRRETELSPPSPRQPIAAQRRTRAPSRAFVPEIPVWPQRLRGQRGRSRLRSLASGDDPPSGDRTDEADGSGEPGKGRTGSEPA